METGVEVFIGGTVLLFLCFLAASITKRKEKKQKPNYKNISQMAKNLSACKVSTRQTVLTELSEDPSWTDEEILELKGVLEGMLDTRITIHSSGQKTSLTARSTK